MDDVPKDQYFEQFLACTRDLIVSPSDQSAYEEAMRKMFNRCAYKLYSIERLLGYFFKQLYSVAQDPSSLHLLRLHQQCDGEDASHGSAYHSRALEFIEDRASLYRVTRTMRAVAVELIGEGKAVGNDLPDPTVSGMHCPLV